MKLVFNRYSLLLLLFVLVPSLMVKAQKWEYGVSLGAAGYMGEYNQDKIYKFTSLVGSLGAKYNFNSTWGVKGDVSLLGIKGDGKKLKDPFLAGKEFNRTLKELSIAAQFNFFKFEPSTQRAAYTPYVFAGIGGILYQDTNDKSEMKPVIPFGAGFKYNLKGNFSLDSHLSYRLAGTDMLDDNGSGWNGDFFDKLNSVDSYMTVQIGLTYTFFKQGCPTW